jgi:RHS repeat-associated protein
VPGIGEVTVFVYSAGGQLAAEYSSEMPQDHKVSYTTADYLGSPRILTDGNGATISRRDFHPFGEEIITANRTAALGYQPDALRQKFTSYERDNESGLDFAQARMYANSHGRFTSPDPVKMSSKRIRNPQGFNLYAYAINNPSRYVDPDGEENEIVTEEREYSFSITKVDTVKGKKITTQIDFKVKEKYVDIYNDAGEKVNTGIRVHVETSNGANAQNLLSSEKLTVPAQNAAVIIAVSWQVGVDKSVALATASKETLMGLRVEGQDAMGL